MVLLHSEKSPLGSKAPSFSLPAAHGPSFTLDSFRDQQVLVVMFICNHCPYVKAIEERLISLGHDYQDKSVQFIGICSNDPTDYPEDSVEALKIIWHEKKYSFPYLIDETQEVAKAYGAVCTPDLYVYDRNRKLAYHGQLDDNWKEPDKVTRQDLKLAIDALLGGERPDKTQIPSMGCSIKWKTTK